MHRRIAALLAVAALGLGVAACSDSGDDDSTVPDTTTTTAVAVDTTTTVPSGPAATPQAASEGLYEAWTNNDQDDASRYARPQAITKMFSHPFTDDTVEYINQGCEPQGGQFSCAYSYEGGAILMTVEALPGGGFVVDSVTYIAD